MLSQVKMGFKGLSIPAKIQKAHLLVNSLTANANFTAPTPALAAVDETIAALETAYQDAADGGKAKKAAMYEREDELDAVVSRLASYVQSASGGNAEKIRSSGFDVRNTATAAGAPDQVMNLTATTSAYPGEVLLSWKPAHGAKSYSVEKSSDGATNWTACGTSTRSKTAINGLASLTNVWFRITAIGVAGEGPESAAVKALVA